MRQSAFHLSIFLGTALCCTALSGELHAENPASAPITRLTYIDPPVKLESPIKHLADEFLPIWHHALGHAELDLQRQVANSIELAHSQGFRDMAEFVEPLTKALATKQLPSSVRTEFARALVALDAKASQQELIKWLGTSVNYDAVVQLALARWQSTQLVDEWSKQVADSKTHFETRLLAAKCLGSIKNLKDTHPLESIVESVSEKTQLRIVAAQALNQVASAVARQLASSLVERTDIASQLVAVELLKSDDSEQAGELNEKLVGSPSPLIVAAVWPQVLKSNPAALVSIADARIADPDAKVRAVAIQALATAPTESRITAIGDRLGDRHESVRAVARDALISLAKAKKFDAEIRQLGETQLQKQDWRAQEQAIIVLASLDHEPAAPKFLELLEHKDDEVAIAAAWGLRMVANKETFAAMLEKANRIEALVQLEKTDQIDSIQMAYIFETFAQEDYRLGEPLMRVYLPKVQIRYAVTEARAAAVYAIGKFCDGTKDDKLADQLIERLNDVESFTPEMEPVRYACAVALGRIGSKNAILHLQKYMGDYGPLAFMCCWSVHKITGDPFVPPPPLSQGRSWVLSPIDRAPAKTPK
jgi:HEAT repeat protein